MRANALILVNCRIIALCTVVYRVQPPEEAAVVFNCVMGVSDTYHCQREAGTVTQHQGIKMSVRVPLKCYMLFIFIQEICIEYLLRGGHFWLE